MGHSHGYRSGTRHMFSRGFKQRGRLPTTQILQPVKVGDYVDIAANATIHKGMPHKYYQGRTGIVYNVSKRAVGVEVNKVVRNRIEKKRINVRIEHIRASKCRKDFLNRVQANDLVKREAKKAGKRVPIEAIKRFPVGPKAGYVVSPSSEEGSQPLLLAPTLFDDML